jgi:hypothetical protein
MTSVFMLLACLMVGTALWFVFGWFQRQLRLIEEERWGKAQRAVEHKKYVPPSKVRKGSHEAPA